MSTLRRQTGRTDRRLHGPADDRGASEVLGAILIFGLLLALLVLLQATVVPVLNEQIEFEQSQRSQNDLEAFQSATFSAAASGDGETLSVESGARYPNRAFLVNPPPATGTLRVGDPLEVSISNVTVDGEAGDYWDGPVTYESRPLVYTPGYREYTAAPTTVYEHSALYNDFGDTHLTVNPGRIVSDDRITLIALSGEYDERSFRAVTVGIEPLSAPSNTVVVESTAASPLTITFETYRSADAWNDALAGEIGTSVEPPVYATAATGPNTVTLKFLPGSYELNMANVGIGTEDTSRTVPAYIADVEGGDRTILNGQSVELTVEVRDAFNNPVSGVVVENERTTAYGALQTVDGTTDEEGKARFRYTADADVGVDELVFTYDASSTDRVTKSTTLIRTAEIPPVVVGVVDGVSQINPSDVGTVILADAETGPGTSKTVTMTFNNTLAESVVIESARLTYYLSGDRSPASTYGDLNGTRLTVGSQLVPLGANEPTLPGGESPVAIVFEENVGGQEDFYILTLEFRGQTTGGTFISTYFVTPT